jgi:hypothetical protein
MKTKLLWALTALCVIVAAGLGFQGDIGAASLTTKAQLVITADLANTSGLATATGNLSKTNWALTLANGVAASQANKIYAEKRTLLTGATDALDLAGSMTDVFGAAFTPAKVKLLAIHSYPTNTTNLTILGNAAAVPILNTVATTATLQPGGTFFFTAPPLAGVAVTASTGDIVQIVNAAGASADYDIVIVGTSS